MNWLIALIFIAVFYSTANTQNIGFGASGMYNFQAEGYGVGARVNIKPDNRISYVPQFSYYFPFNKVTEWTVGLAVEYKFFIIRNFQFYALGQVGYNNWINYQESPDKNAKANNWNLEGGIGISTFNCLRPFVEYRYNLKFQETNLRAGLLYVFGCRSGGRHGICPAYQ